MINKGLRTFLVNGGMVLLILMQRELNSEPPNIFIYYKYSIYNPEFNYVLYYSLFALAIAFLLSGCYIWTKLKNRHWAFMLWGLLAPIGLLGISLLKDKTIKTQTDQMGDK
jgi:hypothetical protein